MACNYCLQLLRLHGALTDSSRAVLEVIVRTPRLLTTFKQKYASEPFSVQTARGVTVHWTQTKAAKAYVRLRLLPDEAPGEAAAAAAPVSTSAAIGPIMAMASAAEFAASVTTPTGAATARSAVAAVAASEGVNVQRGERTSAEGLLQLAFGEKHQQQQQQLERPEGTASMTIQGQVQRLLLALEQEAVGGGAEGSGAMGAAPGAVELDLMVLGGAGGTASSNTNDNINNNCTAAVTSPALGAASGASAPKTWAWSEVMSPPAPLVAATPRDPSSQPSAPRKRSWFLALGLGRGGGAAAANATVASTGSAAEGDGTSPGGSGGTAALAEASGQGTNAWDPVAMLSSATTTTSATATTVATGSSSFMARLVSAPALPHRLRDPNGEARSWGTAAGVPSLTAERRPPPSPPEESGSLPGDATAAATTAAAPPPQSPFAPLSLMANTPPLGAMAGSAVSAMASPPPPVTSAADISCFSEPQQPKRRRLGELLARLFHPLSSNSQVQRILAAEDNLANAGPAASGWADGMVVGGSGPSVSAATPPRTASDTAPAVASSAPPPAADATTWRPPLVRHSSPLSLTPLLPPSPRLGDVYRVLDNALASDTSVQIRINVIGGEEAAAAAAAAASNADCHRPNGILLPGLESPGYADTSPSGGPNRLTIEPPVEDLAAASLASPMETSPVMPTGGCFFWRYGAAARARAAAAAATPPVAASSGAVRCLGRAGSAPMPGTAAAAADVPGSSHCHQLKTLSVADELPETTSSTSIITRRGSGDRGRHSSTESQQQPHQRQTPAQGSGTMGKVRSIRVAEGEASATAAAASAGCGPDVWSHPLEAEISRVVEFVSGQAGLKEEMQAVALSQCQFLLDCLRNQETNWLVGDSLLQLKREVGFPFDTGVPIAGAPDWFRLVLQPLHAPPLHAPPPSTASPQLPPMLPPAELLKVRWACIDQRQIGGTNACAAIGLEVAAWCLSSVQRWRQAVTAAALGRSGSGASGGGGSGGSGGSSGRRDAAVWPQPLPNPESSSAAGAGAGAAGRRDLAPALSRSQRDRDRERLTASIEMEAMSGGALEQCIRAGTEVWQAVLVQSPATRVASSTGDFDLEHMLQLGGYNQRLRLADYSAASLLEDEASAPAAAAATPPRCSLEAASSAAAAATAATTTTTTTGTTTTALQLSTASDMPPPPCRHSGMHSALPTFATLIRSLTQGVYVLGWRGHFATLWLRPGGIVHLIDSLGTRLAADCPLAFVLEFDSPAEFLRFFLARHQAKHDDAAVDDIAGANMAALIEVHKLELLQPAAATASVAVTAATITSHPLSPS